MIEGMCDIVVITGWVDLDIPIKAASQVLTKCGVLGPSKAVDEGLERWSSWQSLLMVLRIRFCPERSTTQDARNLAWLADSLGDRGK